VPCAYCRDPAATGQIGRRCALLEHTFEHGFRPAWHREFAREDHDRRGGGVYANRASARFAEFEWWPIGLAVGTGRTGSDANSGTRYVTGSSACGNGSAGGITRREQVASIKSGIQ
jgi:hypothetical protein